MMTNVYLKWWTICSRYASSWQQGETATWCRIFPQPPFLVVLCDDNATCSNTITPITTGFKITITLLVSHPFEMCPFLWSMRECDCLCYTREYGILWLLTNPYNSNDVTRSSPITMIYKDCDWWMMCWNKHAETCAHVHSPSLTEQKWKDH